VREIGRVRPLKLEAGIALAARIKKGDKQARELMIKSNLPLVVKIARGYEDLGLSLLDLVSEGNIGLLKAVERFDSAKGAKFPSCISSWIRQSIKRALAKQPKISLARHLQSRRLYVY
jgi:RNA polymerase primary sigma factor